MKNEVRQDFTRRIAQANSTELVVILYEMLLCYLEDAASALEPGEELSGEAPPRETLPGEAPFSEAPPEEAPPREADGFREAVRKARGCLNELINSLRMQYEPAPSLMKIYLFCIRRLAFGEQRRDTVPLEEIRRVIEPLRDVYGQLAPQNASGPVMRNAQAVYAGLTYGKNALTENMADQGANRGMRV